MNSQLKYLLVIIGLLVHLQASADSATRTKGKSQTVEITDILDINDLQDAVPVSSTTQRKSLSTWTTYTEYEDITDVSNLKKSARQQKRNEYYENSGFISLSYLGIGVSYSTLDTAIYMSFSTMDLRVGMFGLSPLAFEFSVEPFERRFSYNPSIRVNFPLTDGLSLAPYAGVAVDASYICSRISPKYDYDINRDFYVNGTLGLAVNFSIFKHVPMDWKIELRYPIYERANYGLLFTVQFYMGGAFDRR